MRRLAGSSSLPLRLVCAHLGHIAADIAFECGVTIAAASALLGVGAQNHGTIIILSFHLGQGCHATFAISALTVFPLI